MDINIVLYRAQIGLFYANSKCHRAPKNNFFLLKMAFSRFQIEIYLLVYVILYTVWHLFIDLGLKYYKNCKEAKVLFLLALINRISPGQGMASLFPVSKILLYSGGTLYILKTLFSRQFFLFFNQNEPVAIMLLFLVNNLLDILLRENVTTNYNFRWAEMLHIYGDIHKNPGPPPPKKNRASSSDALEFELVKER